MSNFISDATEQKRSPGLASFTWFTIIWTLIVVLGTFVLLMAASTKDEDSTEFLIGMGLAIPGIFCLPLWVVQYLWYRKVRFAHDITAYGYPYAQDPYAVQSPRQQSYPGIAAPDPIPGGMTTLVEKNALVFGYTQNLSFGLKAFSVFTIGWTIVWGVIWILALAYSDSKDSNPGIAFMAWLFLMAVFCGPVIAGQYFWQGKWKEHLLMPPTYMPGYPPQPGYGSEGHQAAGYYSQASPVLPPVPASPPRRPAPPGYTPVKNPEEQGYQQGYRVGPAQHQHQVHPHYPASGGHRPPPGGPAPPHPRIRGAPPSNSQGTHDHGHIPAVKVNPSAVDNPMVEEAVEETWADESWDDEASTDPDSMTANESWEAESNEQDLLVSKARELEDAGDHLGAIKLYEECGLWEEVDRIVMKDHQSSSQEESE